MAKLAAFRKLTKADARPRVERRRKPRPAAEGFWDRPPLINMLSDMLLLFGILGLSYAALLAVVRLPLFPLKQVVVVSPLDQVTRTQVEYAVQHSLAGNFFTVNLDGMRSSFEKLPWVRKASVRRRWPDGVEVEIEEHVAMARWQNSAGEMRLVNKQGEVFSAALAGGQGNQSGQSGLPLFGGPEGTAPQLLARYLEFSELLAPLGRTPRAVMLSPRHAWQLRLDDGLTLELGRDQSNYSIHDRLQRFAGTYGAAKARLATTVVSIDMRYPNGFALRPGHGATQEAKTVQGAAQNSSKGNT